MRQSAGDVHCSNIGHRSIVKCHRSGNISLSLWVILLGGGSSWHGPKGYSSLKIWLWDGLPSFEPNLSKIFWGKYLCKI